MRQPARGRGRQSGVTLVEVLVALVLFALIGAAGFSMLDQILRVQARTDGRLERLAEMQRAMHLITSDFMQAHGGSLAFADGAVTFRRGAAPTDAAVRYALDGTALTRSLARGFGEAPARQVLVTGVAGLAWRFYAPTTGWTTTWPPGPTERPSQPRGGRRRDHPLRPRTRRQAAAHRHPARRGGAAVSRPRDAGVVLVNVLVLLGLAASVVYAMLALADLSIARSRRFAEAGRALALVRAGEQSAIAALRRDMIEAPAIDHPGEAWTAVAQAGVDIGGGAFELQIADAQDRFNLNSLRGGGLQARQTLDAIVAHLELPEETAERIADSLERDGPLRELGELARRAGIPPEEVALLRHARLGAARPGRGQRQRRLAGPARRPLAERGAGPRARRHPPPRRLPRARGPGGRGHSPAARRRLRVGLLHRAHLRARRRHPPGDGEPAPAPPRPDRRARGRGGDAPERDGGGGASTAAAVLSWRRSPRARAYIEPGSLGDPGIGSFRYGKAFFSSAALIGAPSVKGTFPTAASLGRQSPRLTLFLSAPSALPIGSG